MTGFKQGAYRCPACGFHQFQVGNVCVRCGSPKGSRGAKAAQRVITLDAVRIPDDRFLGLERGSWLALAFGLFLAVFILKSSLLSYLFGMITTMVHELGHSVGGWFYGYPSIPTFDFIYGGGITLQQERLWWLAAGVALMFVWFMYKYRHNRATLALLSAALAVYGITALTPAHQGLILSLGHGAELLFAGILLYRAMSGSAIRHALVRPLYAFISLFVILDNIRFSYLLAFDDTQRHQYETVSAIGFQMDFSRLAEHYLSVSVSTIALAFFALCLLTPAFSYLYLRDHDRITRVIASLRRQGPEQPGV